MGGVGHGAKECDSSPFRRRQSFLLASRWVGGRGVVNLLGLAAVVLFWIGLAVGAVWWLVRAV